MKKSELLQSICEISTQLEMAIDSIEFVRSKRIDEINSNLNIIITDIINQWIQPENYIENKIQFCWNCHQKISLIKKRIDSWMVSWLIKAYNFVIKNQRQLFQIQEIWLNSIEYWKLNNLVRFWLLYKDEWMNIWVYWVPRRTVSKFLAWEWKVAEYYQTDPTKKEWEEGRRFMSKNRITINEIPSVWDLKKQFWEKLVEYEWNELFE